MANYGIKVETVLGKFYDVRQDETIKGLYEVRKKENPEEDIMWYFFSSNNATYHSSGNDCVVRDINQSNSGYLKRLKAAFEKAKRQDKKIFWLVLVFGDGIDLAPDGYDWLASIELRVSLDDITASLSMRKYPVGKGKEGFVKFIEVALKIITYLLPVIQIISIVFYSETAHIVLQFTGVVITMFGVLAFIVSVTQMKENWRAGVQKEEKTNLVTTGIYSISRNPAFLGFDLMYIGILFSFFNWFLCFATGFAVVFFHLQIVNVEEDFLIEAFGNEYLQYKSKVCRYLGRKR